RADLFGERAAEGAARLVAAVARVLGRGPDPEILAWSPAPDRDADPAFLTVGGVHAAQDDGGGRPPRAPGSSPGGSHYLSYQTPVVEGVVFTLDHKTGGLIIYAGGEESGRNFALWINKDAQRAISANAVRRVINGVAECAAVFPSVPAGNHT